jgi:hypothetical protein
MYPSRRIDKVGERGETRAVDPEIAETCRHIDEIGESLRSEIRSLGELIHLLVAKMNRRMDEQAARSDRIEGCPLRLETRVSILEDDPRPRRRRCGR